MENFNFLCSARHVHKLKSWLIDELRPNGQNRAHEQGVHIQKDVWYQNLWDGRLTWLYSRSPFGFEALRKKCPNTEFFWSVFGHFSRSDGVGKKAER